MDNLKQLFNQLSEQAHKDQVQLEMLVTQSEGLKLSSQKRKIDKFESTQSQMAGLRVIYKGAQGYAYTEKLSQDSLLLTYKAALENAQMMSASEGEQSAQVALPNNNQIQKLDFLFHSEEIPMSDKLKLAIELESQALDADPRVKSVSYNGFYESKGKLRILNTNGLDVESQSNSYGAYVYPLVEENDSKKQDGESCYSKKFAEIHADKIAQKGVSRSLSRLNAKKIKSGSYPVLFDKDVVNYFISMIESHLSAKEVYNHQSLLENKLNIKLGSEKFNLIDDPFYKEGVGSRPFDSEGSLSRQTVVFEKGVLKNYLTNLEYAAKLNLENTANASRSPMSTLNIAPSNLIIQSGESDFKDMINSYPEVIHIVEFNGGLHAGYKESTGDFSLPAEGFLYKNGQKQYAIEQFVVSGNIFELINKIEAVGKEMVQPGSSLIGPDLLVSAISISGEK